MLLIDANAVLRYILSDNEDMAQKVCDLLNTSRVTVRYEVFAEVVYVLLKVYSIPRDEIADTVKKFAQLPNVEAEHDDVLSLALDTFAEKNIDFVDSVLYGFAAMNGCDVFTFDKKLNALINK